MIRPRIPGIIIEDFCLLQFHAFSIQLPKKPGIIRTFHPFLRRKNAETNSTNWRGDLRPDWTMIPENGKNPCFDPPIGIFSRRTPTEILPSIMGMQRACSERGDTPGSSLRRRHPSREAVPAPNQVLFAENQVLIAKKRPFYSNVPT